MLTAIVHLILQSDFDCEPTEGTHSQTGLKHSFPLSVIVCHLLDHIACLRIPGDGILCKELVWLSSHSDASATSDLKVIS